MTIDDLCDAAPQDAASADWRPQNRRYDACWPRRRPMPWRAGIWRSCCWPRVASARPPPTTETAIVDGSGRGQSARGGVGVKVSGNPTHSNDGKRSLPAKVAAELPSLDGEIDLDPASTGARNFQDTAEIVAGLDLVISVDTSVAHLAAATGKPTWILLPFFSTDWRWMRGWQDSPWYPSVRLFRQGADEDWAPVIGQVRSALGRFAKHIR
jgi:hypothetical protein